MLLKKFCEKGDSPSFLIALYHRALKNPSLNVGVVLKAERTASPFCYLLIVDRETVIL